MNDPTPGEIQKFFALVWDGEIREWILIPYSLDEMTRMFSL